MAGWMPCSRSNSNCFLIERWLSSVGPTRYGGVAEYRLDVLFGDTFNIVTDPLENLVLAVSVVLSHVSSECCK